jgi:AcrR family transcriptional regulator
LQTLPTANQTQRQNRAIQTRRRLLEAARVVFARDGFEHASLQDIATLAGKTRGAFYDNFQNKEDVFFAIFEEDLNRDKALMSESMRQSSTLEGRLDRLAQCLFDFIQNKERTLLYAEFKTYAIRSPHHRKRLADLHAAIRMECSLPELDEVIPALEHQPESVKREMSLAISGILDGLSLNVHFDPGSANPQHLKNYLRWCIEEAIRNAVSEK